LRPLTSADESAEADAEAEPDGYELQAVSYMQAHESWVTEAVQKWKKTKHDYEERSEHPLFFHNAFLASLSG